jgi:hypothetical protein
MSDGWIGVDLDGTLAEYHGWAGEEDPHGGIGAPVPAMLARVKRWLEEGKEVRIFTARVAHDHTAESLMRSTRQAAYITAYCMRYVGQALPITCQKDMSMLELWDDRCVQVLPNTGEPVTGSVSDHDREVWK